MNIFQRLWKDERGFLISVELILAAVLLVFGMIVGFEKLREATVQELSDLADAIGAINNSYEWVGTSFTPASGAPTVVVEGSAFVDAEDGNDSRNGTRFQTFVAGFSEGTLLDTTGAYETTASGT